MNILMDDVFLFFLIASLVGVVYYFPRDKHKRNTLALVSLLSFVLFGVAHDRENEKKNEEIGQIEIPEDTEVKEVSENKKEKHEKKKTDLKKDAVYEAFEFDEEFENNEEVEVRLLTIEKLENDFMDRDRIEATFEFKNKTDRLLQVRAKTISINDYMINNSLYMLREEISPGKSVVSTLVIEDYQDQVKIPNLENNFELTLEFFDWDELGYEVLVDVDVDFK